VCEQITEALRGDDFRPWERVVSVLPLLEPFNMANLTMTMTMKVKKNVAMEKYSEAIKQMYNEA